MMFKYSVLIAIIFLLTFLNVEATSQTTMISKAQNPKKNYYSVDKTYDSLKDLYRQGYELIIAERWTEARDIFNRLINDSIASKYKEMGQYWIAYTLKEEKVHEAVDAYKNFINKYPESNYFDDAIADLKEIQFEKQEPFEKSVPIIRIDGRGNVKTDSLLVLYKHLNRGFSFYVNVIPRVASLEKLIQIKVTDRTPATSTHLEDLIPPEMQKKLSVVIDKDDLKLDSGTFHLLQKVALDKSKPEDIREAAVVSLSLNDLYDPLPVFKNIIINDTNKGLQFYALENLREYTKDREKAVKTMIKMFKELPEEKEDERMMLFYSIADIGTDEAVDFLIDIVEKNVKDEYFDEAVYYLGSIGTEKARNTLKKVYRQK